MYISAGGVDAWMAMQLNRADLAWAWGEMSAGQREVYIPGYLEEGPSGIRCQLQWQIDR